MRKILTLLMAFALSSFAWAEYDEGIDYEVLKKAQPAPTGGKVEVIEFFSYGCPHCYRFEPYIEKWQEKKSDNIEFIQVPAIFSKRDKNGRLVASNKNWEDLAILYYAAEVLGVEKKMHPAIFEAMHGKGKKMRTVKELKSLFLSKGISNEKLEQALKSFTVAAKTRRAMSMTQAYGINSVPNIVVQGKYRTNGTLAQGHKNVFKIVDHLAEKISKESIN